MARTYFPYIAQSGDVYALPFKKLQSHILSTGSGKVFISINIILYFFKENIFDIDFTERGKYHGSSKQKCQLEYLQSYVKLVVVRVFKDVLMGI